MTKTKRLIEADLKMVDAVVEITDARIPESSRNPVLDELVKDKPRIILMNKCDYADENATRLWKQYYEKRGIRVLTCDCRSGKGLNRFLPEVKTLLAELIERRKKRGMIGKALRLMVVGIPNVGKSSFINRMAKTKKTKVGDKPGVTRGKQWVSIDKDVELLDMPGILWPKFDDQTAAQRLAFTGAIKDDVMDTEALARGARRGAEGKVPGAAECALQADRRAGYPDGYREVAGNAGFRRRSGYRACSCDVPGRIQRWTNWQDHPRTSGKVSRSSLQ